MDAWTHGRTDRPIELTNRQTKINKLISGLQIFSSINTRMVCECTTLYHQCRGRQDYILKVNHHPALILISLKMIIGSSKNGRWINPFIQQVQG